MRECRRLSARLVVGTVVSRRDLQVGIAPVKSVRRFGPRPKRPAVQVGVLAADDVEADGENRHATFVAWANVEVPLPIEQIAQAHDCPEDRRSQAEMDEETRKTMEAMGKRCPACSSLIQKNDGCDWMTCGTTAHGSLADCIRNGGCGSRFNGPRARSATTRAAGRISTAAFAAAGP